jgi:mannose-1-phosphate guanylyltransferase / phosphomannomutase
VIMPNTYIGELVEITNAIVAGNRLIHVDTGTITTVTDSFLLANIGPDEIGVSLRTVVDRVLGAGLLALSLCLWPLALLAAMVAHPRQPLRSKRLVGNRKRGSAHSEFTAFEFATPVPVLRYLPYLLAVVSGHLRLVGVEPLEAGSDAPTEDWELVRNEGEVGLFGPVQLAATHETPEEERTIVEACYIGTRSIAHDLRWMLRAAVTIASRRAWWPAKSLAASNVLVMPQVSSPPSSQNARGQIEFELFERIAPASGGAERNATP